jgi:hypothetical protein
VKPTATPLPTQSTMDIAIKSIEESFIKLENGINGCVPHYSNSTKYFTEDRYKGRLDYSDGYGPEAFFIDGDNIYIGNSVNNKILVFNKGKYVSEIYYQSIFNLQDFIVSDDYIYILDTNNTQTGVLACIDLEGKIMYQNYLPALNYVPASNLSDGSKYLESHLLLEDGNPVLVYTDGKSFVFDESSWELSERFNIDYSLTGNNKVVLDNSGIEISTIGNFTSLRVVYNENNLLLLCVSERFYEKNVITIVEDVIYYITDNEIQNKVRLLNSPYRVNNYMNYVRTDINGNLYQMFRDEDFNLHIYKLNLDLEYVSTIEPYYN